MNYFWMVLLGVVCTVVMGVYLANGQLVSIRQWFRLCREQVNEETNTETLETTNAEHESGFRHVPLSQRWEVFWKNKALLCYCGISFVVSLAFCIYRQNYLSDILIVNLEHMVLLYIFLVVAYIDFQLFIIPNEVVLVELGFWVVCTAISRTLGDNGLGTLLLYSGLGWLMGAGVLLLCRLLMKGSLGWGDIKLMGVTGMICGFYKTFNILFYSLFLSFLVGIFLLATKKVERKSRIPMGPFLLGGFFITCLQII